MLSVKAKVYMDSMVTLEDLERMTGVDAAKWSEWIRSGDLDASVFVGRVPAKVNSTGDGFTVVSLPHIRAFIESWNKCRPKIELKPGTPDRHSFWTYDRNFFGEPFDK